MQQYWLSIYASSSFLVTYFFPKQEVTLPLRDHPTSGLKSSIEPPTCISRTSDSLVIEEDCVILKIRRLGSKILSLNAPMP
jgi:hypothetical protein